jgi:hypothetical protein
MQVINKGQIMAKNKLPENEEYQTLKLELPKKSPLSAEQDLRDFKPNGQEPETKKPQTLELRTDKKFPKDHPMNPDYVSPVDNTLNGGSASGTGQKNGTGTSAAAMERGLPDKSQDNLEKAAAKAERTDAERTSRINMALAPHNLTEEEKLHAEAGLKAQSTGNGGKLPSSGDITATVQAVTGRVDNLPDGVRQMVAQIGKELKDSGSSMPVDKKEPSAPVVTAALPQTSISNQATV